MILRRAGETLAFVLSTFALALVAGVALLAAALPTAMAAYVASLNDWNLLSVQLLVLVVATSGFLALSALRSNMEMIRGSKTENANPLWFFVSAAIMCTVLAPLAFAL